MDPGIGKWLVAAGAVLVVAGLLVIWGAPLGWLGRLPGDFSVKKDGFSFYFPLASSIVVSVILSVILWIFRR